MTEQTLSDRIKDFLNQNDRFCRCNNIRLTKVAPGYAEAVMEITEDKLNSRGVVQGGAIFTLADITFAGAANGSNCVMPAMNASITFVRPGSGPALRAVARQLSRGKRTGLYSIEVFNSDDKLVAHATINGFDTGAKLVEE